jgi:hypothetical protein
MSSTQNMFNVALAENGTDTLVQTLKIPTALQAE